MFRASLLYLPVFMSGLLFHRLPESQQCQTLQNSHKSTDLSSSSELLLDENERVNHRQSKVKSKSVDTQGRPPVAYASIAPFPFLPAPTYVLN